MQQSGGWPGSLGPMFLREQVVLKAGSREPGGAAAAGMEVLGGQEPGSC